jgi:hypothetical protein
MLLEIVSLRLGGLVYSASGEEFLATSQHGGGSVWEGRLHGKKLGPEGWLGTETRDQGGVSLALFS